LTKREDGGASTFYSEERDSVMIKLGTYIQTLWHLNRPHCSCGFAFRFHYSIWSRHCLIGAEKRHQ